MRITKSELLGMIPGILMIAGDLIFLRSEKIFSFILVLALVIITIPFVLAISLENKKQKELDERFLAFVRDLVENVKSGTPISKSIVNLKERDYGGLTIHVGKLANQIILGIPLTNALMIFAKDTKSPVITRAVSLISEAERSGGQIDTILESVARSVNQIENLKKERQSTVYNLVVQIYIIFIIFLIIMLVLQFEILPKVTSVGGSVEGLSVSSKANTITPTEFSRPLLIIILVQSLFTGLMIGKIAEGSLKAGIKHSFILLVISSLISTGANALFG
ncbi:MAG: type II secretion system F family protein [Nanoarchaeota archaeon]|nr:type II secretion system F family protein [Nanoarchaeota archaeon]